MGQPSKVMRASGIRINKYREKISTGFSNSNRESGNCGIFSIPDNLLRKRIQKNRIK